MRVLTAATIAELGLTVTKPGLLVEIQFSGETVRLSSFGDVVWNGLPWVGAIVSVSGLAWDDNGMVRGGQLRAGNLDGAFGALVLLYGIADRPVKLWHVYAGAMAPADPPLIFDGVGDEAQIDLREVVVSLAVAGSDALYCPRQVYSPATGCNFIPSPGEEIAFNGEIFRLERADF